MLFIGGSTMEYVKEPSLSPPDPTVQCRICECYVYSYADLENGLCDNCVEDYICIECGEESATTDDYGICYKCLDNAFYGG